MPELPEVQTIVNELKKKVVGKKITDVWGDWAKTFRQAGGLKNFQKKTKNRKILNIGRRAKYIVIDLEGPSPRRSLRRSAGKTILIHQKISGHLLYGKWERENGKWRSKISGPLKDDRRNQYIRVVFFLNNGYQLALSDLRRFGKVILVNDDRIETLKEIKELGPEPLEISFNQFKKLFESAGRRKRGRLKQVLMDQTFIASIGNIYSDEILWDAGYHPLSRVEKLKERDLKKIYKSMKNILLKAIKYQGDSIDDYRLPSGKKGRYQEIQKAYQQTGKKCAKGDGGIIKRLKIAGRSAHFCPVHQEF